MDCDGCVVTLTEAIIKFQTRANSIVFLQNHGVLKREVVCASCGNPATLHETSLMWRCQRRHEELSNKKIIRKRCNFKQSLRTKTWLANANLSPERCCMFLAYFMLLNPPHVTFLMNELQIGTHTVSDWSNFIREVLEYWVIRNSPTKLGGIDKIVEIDEAKFGKRKYNRGRIVDGEWVFGGLERGSKEVFMELVPDRSANTLLQIIKRKIEPGTTIMSDCWKAYNCLQNEGI